MVFPFLSWFGKGRIRPLDGPPTLPPGLAVFAVGDIHGRLDLLQGLLAQIRQRVADHRGQGRRVAVIFLGDYIDRGPDSKGVLDLLCGDPVPDAECRFLLGNHEIAMRDFLVDPIHSPWLHFGGMEAVASYGLRGSVGVESAARRRALRDQLQEAVPAHHLAFLAGLEDMAVVGDYVFVHAGIRPGVSLARQRQMDLTTIRQPFLDHPSAHERFVVHGHTISDGPDDQGNRLGIDTGGYATGILTAVEIVGAERRILQYRV